jgi:hypothetical protein
MAINGESVLPMVGYLEIRQPIPNLKLITKV